MSLIDELTTTRNGKRERIALLASGEMRTVLYGIDVTEATLAQERAELEMIMSVLRKFTTVLEE